MSNNTLSPEMPHELLEREVFEAVVDHRSATLDASVAKAVTAADAMGVTIDVSVESSTELENARTVSIAKYSGPILDAEVVKSGVEELDPELLTEKESYEIMRARRDIERAYKGEQLSIHAEKTQEADEEPRAKTPSPSLPKTELEEELNRLVVEARARIKLAHAGSEILAGVKGGR